jgi:hypothetical protein
MYTVRVHLLSAIYNTHRDTQPEKVVRRPDRRLTTILENGFFLTGCKASYRDFHPIKINTFSRPSVPSKRYCDTCGVKALNVAQ